MDDHTRGFVALSGQPGAVPGTTQEKGAKLLTCYGTQPDDGSPRHAQCARPLDSLRGAAADAAAAAAAAAAALRVARPAAPHAAAPHAAAPVGAPVAAAPLSTVAAAADAAAADPAAAVAAAVGEAGHQAELPISVTPLCEEGVSEEAFAALNATFHDLGADLDAAILIDVVCRKTATVNLEVEDGEPSAAWLTTAAQLVIECNATDCTVSAEVGADDRRRRLQIAGTDDLVARAPTYTFRISVSVPIVRLFGGSPLDMEAQLQAISAASTNLATTLARSWLVGGTL